MINLTIHILDQNNVADNIEETYSPQSGVSNSIRELFFTGNNSRQTHCYEI